ncbi:hypothetical protein ARUE_c00370 [Arthrobacter sp. Rue61a]|nr:hypothetical protein ARUE_c00370 [Arthrobacter sp. Rue61a]
MGLSRRLGEAHTQRLSSLFSAVGVEHEISCDAKDPCPRLILMLRRFRKPPPDYEKCLSYYVLGIRHLGSTLNKLQ